MLTFTYALNFLLMIAMPVALGWFLARRFGLAWRLYIVGAITFVLSQVFHIPFNAGLTLAFRNGLLPAPPPQYHLIFNAVVLGLSAGIFEETARYLVLRFSLKEARSWRTALMFGAGHGGVEAIILGLLAGLSFVNLSLIRQNPALLAALPAEQLALAQQQVADYWSAPVVMSVLGAVERLFALGLHLSLAVLVMQVFLRGQLRWLFAAIAWHALGNAVTVVVLDRWGALAAEAALAVIALLSLGILFALRSPEPKPEEPPAPPPLDPFASPPHTKPTAEALERSRFQ